MTNRYGFFAVTILFASAASAVTLGEAFNAAQSKTESVSIERTRLNEADARVDQIRGNFLPHLSLSATGKRTGAPSADTVETKSTQATLNQSIFAGGLDAANFKGREKEREAQDKTVSAVLNGVFADVADSFYAVMSAEQDAENIRRSFQLTEDRVKELQKRKAIGKSRNIDVLAAQAQSAVLTAQLVSAQRLINAARNRFTLLTGLPHESQLSDPAQMPEAPQGLDAYLKTVDQRPDVEALTFLNEAAKNYVSAARAGHWPALDLAANYYFDRTSTSPAATSTGSGWDATLTLSFPLFEGGTTQALVRERSERELETDLLLRRQRRQAETEIREAHDRVVSARNQVTTLEKALTITEQNYREQEKDYRFSLATNLDVIQALNTFQETKRTLDKTRFEALAAWAALRAATDQVPRTEVTR